MKRISLLSKPGEVYGLCDPKPVYSILETVRILCPNHGERVVLLSNLFEGRISPCPLCNQDNNYNENKRKALLQGTFKVGYTDEGLYYEGQDEKAYESEKDINKQLVNILFKRKRK